MNRRGFLGLVGGAAVAGPAVAKNVVATTTPLSAGSAVAGLNMVDDIWDAKNVGYATSLGSSGNWRIDRLAKLRRLISGEDVEEDEDIRPPLRAKEMNIHALGSVAPAAKVRMLRNAVRDAKQEMRRKSWLSELLHLEEQEDYK